MTGKIIGYHYKKLKDTIKWNGLRPKRYVPLIDAMFNKFAKAINS
jgi:hypothetical protein